MDGFASTLASYAAKFSSCFEVATRPDSEA